MNHKNLRINSIASSFSKCQGDISFATLKERVIFIMGNVDNLIIFFGGLYNAGFAVFHLMFWRIFKWKQDLAILSPINRGIMQILNLRLTYIFIVMAYISFFHSSELLEVSIGKTLLISFSLFWFLRMVEQIIFFSIKNPISLALTVVFFIGGVIYLVPLF